MNHNPVRVLHVVANLNIGGLENFLMNLYRNVNRNKIQFDFVKHTNRKSEFDQEVLEMGGKIYCCPDFDLKNMYAFIIWWKKFYQNHPEYKMIHGHVRSTAFIYLYFAKKNKRIAIIHSHSTSNGIGGKGIVKNMLQYPVRNIADYFFACSTEAGQWMFGKEISQKRNFKVIHNGNDFNRFMYDREKRKHLREKYHLKDVIVIGHTGNFTGAKNHKILLKIFQEVRMIRKNTKLLLVGKGDIRSVVTDEIEKSIFQDVICVGGRRNVEDYYLMMDVFVFPSLWEGLGMAVIEAQAMGLYCIVSDCVPRAADFGQNKVGFLSLDLSPRIWAEEIIKIIDKKSESSRDSCSNSIYDIRSIAKMMEKFYVSGCI